MFIVEFMLIKKIQLMKAVVLSVLRRSVFVLAKKELIAGFLRHINLNRKKKPVIYFVNLPKKNDRIQKNSLIF
jgi:hypothetical protein